MLKLYGKRVVFLHTNRFCIRPPMLHQTRILSQDDSGSFLPNNVDNKTVYVRKRYKLKDLFDFLNRLLSRSLAHVAI